MAPMATTTQAAIRARPEIEGLILLVSVLTAVLLLVGGAVGDTRRARPIITGGLAVSLVCAILALVLDSGDAVVPGRALRGHRLRCHGHAGRARDGRDRVHGDRPRDGHRHRLCRLRRGPGSLADAGRACPGQLRAGLRRLDRGLRPGARRRPGPHPRAPETDRCRAAIRVRDRALGDRRGALRRRGPVAWLRPRQPAADRADPGRHRPGRSLHPLGAPPQGHQCRDRAHRTPSGDRRAVRGPGHRHRADRADVAAAALLRRRDAVRPDLRDPRPGAAVRRPGRRRTGGRLPARAVPAPDPHHRAGCWPSAWATFSWLP